MEDGMDLEVAAAADEIRRALRLLDAALDAAPDRPLTDRERILLSDLGAAVGGASDVLLDLRRLGR